MSLHQLNLFSIPAGASFLDHLAKGLIARYGIDGLAGIDVALPNRRAVRGLIDAFLRASDGRVIMLPALRAIGDVDEEDLILDPAPGFDDPDLPPAIGPIERQLILARLIAASEPDTSDFATAVQLADALGRLIDEVAIQERSFDDLAKLVPDRFAAHWQKVLEFLSIITKAWPAILAERGAIDAADRRGRLLHILAARLQASPPKRPLVIAGSTGSIPASAALMAQVARLDHCMVVLPGLDFQLDEDSYKALEPGHPQWGMRETLTRMGATRADVRPFLADDAPSARAILLSEALRPAATTDLWRDAPQRLGAALTDALSGLTILEAATEVEEAAAIALAMRAAMEVPGRTAALVTPDRHLARRVGAELSRWRIAVDDSAGRPLSKMPAGLFLRLILDVADDTPPDKILALLKHPLSALCLETDAYERAVIALELEALRGPRPLPGIEPLIAKVKSADARDLGSRLQDAFAPLMDLTSGTASLTDWIDAHAAVAEALALTPTSEGAARLWGGDDGAALVDTLGSIRAADVLPPITLADYAALIGQLMDQTPVRPHRATHPRLAILGPIEARLARADLMILGGLNEETWPQASAIDPWFSRPMRADFGLDPPERRLGQSAHDFVMAASAPLVILTRAVKVGGSPSVPSRWLLRLKTMIAGLGLKISPDPDAPDYLAIAQKLDRPSDVRAIQAPMPRPPVAARPRQLSVTRIETLIRDPYSIYARYILDLKVLDPIDKNADAAIRGTLIHKMLEEFSRLEPAPSSDGRRQQFLTIAQAEAADVLRRPALAALWWPRLERMADWLSDLWPKLSAIGTIVGVECTGAVTFDAPGGSFTLTAKADRIDRRATGLAIIDYKTGSPPSPKQIENGLAPQLPLEAAIAAQGGFAGIAPAPPAGFEVIRLSGGEPAGEHLTFEKLDAASLTSQHFKALQHLIGQYDHEATPYRSRPRAQFVARYGDYDHLARVLEWSTAGGGDGGDGGGE